MYADILLEWSSQAVEGHSFAKTRIKFCRTLHGRLGIVLLLGR